MRLLVLGTNGLLGSNVLHTASIQDWDVVGTYHSEVPAFETPLHELDIRDENRFEEVLERVDPDGVINCAAMTDVDACERNPDQAWAVNAAAPGTLAEACATVDVGFCHISTDYVFSGDARTPYTESTETDPRQIYGESKLAGEHAVRDGHPSPLIIRLSFVYGIHRSNGSLVGFPAWVRNRIRSEDRVPLFVDQYITPSRAGQVADTLLRLLEQRASGMYHVACRSCVTPYEFGDHLRKRMNAPETVLEKGSLNDTDRPAKRPRYTCLAVDKVEAFLDISQPTLAADLDSIEALLTM